MSGPLIARRPDALADFRAAVLAEPAWQERLAAIYSSEEYVSAAIALAATRGIVLDMDAVRREIQPDICGLARFTSRAFDACVPPPGWLPARSVPTGGAPAFDWLWFGADRIDGPFFDDDVRRADSIPFARMFQIRTCLDTIAAGAADTNAAPLGGLIFHMSRCGSTLAAQMLAALPGYRVLSEPEPIDAVVQWAATSAAPFDAKVSALRAMVAAMGRHRNGEPQRVLLKTDFWHALQWPLFRAAFPDVPWLFLHRDPADVLVSQARMPGLNVIAGAMPPGCIPVDPATATSPIDYAAQVIGQVLAAAAAQSRQGGGMIVEYPDVATAMLDAIPAHFGFVPNPAERAAMIAATERDAKAPGQPFRDDRAAKGADVSPEIAHAVARHLASQRAALLALDV